VDASRVRLFGGLLLLVLLLLQQQLHLLLRLHAVSVVSGRLLLELLQQIVVMLLLLVFEVGLVVRGLLLLLLLVLLTLGLRVGSSRGAELEEIQQVGGAIRVGRHGTAVDGWRRRRREIHDCGLGKRWKSRRARGATRRCGGRVLLKAVKGGMGR
jgi:hypothetical protein